MNKLLIGFSAGLLVGVLFAPAKGSETRESIAQKGKDLKDKFNDLVDSVSEKFQSAGSEAEDLFDQGARKARSYANEVS